MSKQTENTLPVLSNVAPETLVGLVSDARSVFTTEQSLTRFAELFGPTMAIGDDPGDYDAHQAFCRAWRVGYQVGSMGSVAAYENFDPSAANMERVELVEASKKALLRRFQAADRDDVWSAVGFKGAKRPRSQNAASVARAENRAKLPEGTPEQWLEKAAKAAKAGDAVEANKASAAAAKLAKAADAAIKKAATERVKPLREEFAKLVAAIKSAPDAEDRIARAVAALRPIAPKPESAPKGTGKFSKVPATAK